MNSVILSSLVSFFGTLGAWFKNSGLYALFMKIYTAVSNSWKNSAVMTWIRSAKSDGASVKSASAKVLFSPFALLDVLRGKAGEFLDKNISQSFICVWAKTYMQNFMAVNTRFFGIMLIAMAFSYCAASRHISKIALIAGAVGAVLCIVNYNLMSFLNPSKFVGIVKSMAGFKDLDFEFFDETKTHGILRLVLALAAGLITGAAVSFNALYGAVIPFAVFGLVLVMYAPITGV